MGRADRDFSLGKSEVTPELLADVAVSLAQLQQWQERMEGFARELQGQGWIVEISVESTSDRHGVTIHVTVRDRPA